MDEPLKSSNARAFVDRSLQPEVEIEELFTVVIDIRMDVDIRRDFQDVSSPRYRNKSMLLACDPCEPDGKCLLERRQYS